MKDLLLSALALLAILAIGNTALAEIPAEVKAALTTPGLSAHDQAVKIREYLKKRWNITTEVFTTAPGKTALRISPVDQASASNWNRVAAHLQKDGNYQMAINISDITKADNTPSATRTLWLKSLVFSDDPFSQWSEFRHEFVHRQFDLKTQSRFTKEEIDDLMHELAVYELLPGDVVGLKGSKYYYRQEKGLIVFENTETHERLNMGSFHNYSRQALFSDVRLIRSAPLKVPADSLGEMYITLPENSKELPPLVRELSGNRFALSELPAYLKESVGSAGEIDRRIRAGDYVGAERLLGDTEQTVGNARAFQSTMKRVLEKGLAQVLDADAVHREADNIDLDSIFGRSSRELAVTIDGEKYLIQYSSSQYTGKSLHDYLQRVTHYVGTSEPTLGSLETRLAEMKSKLGGSICSTRAEVAGALGL